MTEASLPATPEQQLRVVDDQHVPLPDIAAFAFKGLVNRITGHSTAELQRFVTRLVLVAGAAMGVGFAVVDHAANKATESSPAIGAGVAEGFDVQAQGKNFGAGFERWIVDTAKSNPSALYAAEEFTHKDFTGDDIIGKPKKHK